MNRKKLAAIMVFGLTMTTCSTPASGHTTLSQTISYKADNPKSQMISMVEDHRARQANMEAELARIELFQNNRILVKRAIKKLHKQVGKTWYVFSGSTPSGWDCSGMTMWFYGHLGVELEHRATKQSQSGMHTDNPKLGDIVVFKYKGSKSAYHVGIWISEDKMLHSGGKEGDRTEYESISRFAGNYSEVSYRTFIETN